MPGRTHGRVGHSDESRYHVAVQHPVTADHARREVNADVGVGAMQIPQPAESNIGYDIPHMPEVSPCPARST